MTPPRNIARLSIVLGILLLALTACGGRLNTLEEFNQSALSEGSSSTAQGEIQEIMQAAQAGILGALVENNQLQTSSCKPEFTLSFAGIGFKFTDSGSCRLRGRVLLKLFPLRANVDLHTVGMTYVEHMSFDADIKLTGGGGTNVEWVFHNGRIDLKNFKLLPVDTLVLSGRASASFMQGSFAFYSRTNAFDASSRFGVTLISDFGNGTRSVRACLLKGGNGTNPDAGQVNNCLAILN